MSRNPPAPFSRLLIRVDPMLKYAPWCFEYMVFAERRERHGGSPLLMPDGMVTLVRPLAIGLAILAGGVAVLLDAINNINVPGWFPAGVLVLVVVMLFVPNIIRRLRRNPHRMPWTVTEAFAPAGTPPQVAVDLYLAGATGTGVMFAMYLEKARWAWVTPVTGAVIIAAGHLPILALGGMISPWMVLVMVPLVFWVAVRCAKTGMLLSRRARARSIVRSMEALWCGDTSAGSDFAEAGRTLRSMLIWAAVPLLFLVGIIFLAALQVVIFLIMGQGLDKAWTGGIIVVPVLTVLASTLLCVAITHIINRRLRRWLKMEFPVLFHESPAAKGFADFIRDRAGSAL